MRKKKVNESEGPSHYIRWIDLHLCVFTELFQRNANRETKALLHEL